MTVRIVDGQKPCSRCKLLLPVACFTKLSKTLAGLASACRQCDAGARDRIAEARWKRERYQNDPAFRRRVSLASMRWAAAHREKFRGYQRAYIQRRRAKLIELKDMSAAAQQIVAAGTVIAGTVPSGLNKEELMVWLDRTFAVTGDPDADAI